MSEDEANAGVAMSMVPLGPTSKVSAGALIKDLAETWPELPAATKPEKGDKSLIFHIGDTMVALGFMPAPIPWSELEGPCATSVLFPNAAEILKPHQSHVLITLIFKSECTPIERATLLTKVTASFVKICEASLGIYWGNATMVLPPDLFREVAVDCLPELPSLIWIDIRVGANDQGTTSGFTCGMQALGLMELETENANEPPMELRNRFEGVAGYLLENGLVIKDGDTVGETMNEQIKVSYAPSSFGHEGQVMRFDYTSTSKKKKGWFGRG